MLTVNDIREVTFNKSMRGYKPTEVYAFIDQCADAIDSLTRSNADLEKKLEVLADKLVEYRNEEDSIRTALLSAQRLGDTVVREANHKAGLILEDAKIKADKIQETARRSIQEEERELLRVRREVSDFKSRLLSIYREHLAVIDILPEEKPEAVPEGQSHEADTAAPEPAAEAAEKESETETPQAETESVSPAGPEPADANAAEPALNISIISESAAEAPVEAPAEAPAAAPNEAGREAASVSRFSNLKFGDDYDISKDDEDSAGFFRHHK